MHLLGVVQSCDLTAGHENRFTLCYCCDENILAVQNGSARREGKPPRPLSCYVPALVLMQMLFPPLLPPALVWCQAAIKDISGTGDTEA